MRKTTRKIGLGRGKARLWIEGKVLAEAGWNKGVPFVAVFEEGLVRYLPVLHPATVGLPERKVAGMPDRPIIDTNTDKLLDALGVEVGDHVELIITPTRIEVRKLEGGEE